MASTWPPVFFAYASMYFQSSAGSELSKAEKGRTWFTRSALSRKMTVRCRLLPPGAEVHSKPCSVVKTPGWFHFSAAAVACAQAAPASLSLLKTGLPVCMETTASMAALTPSSGLVLDISYQRLPCGLSRSSGLPARI